MTGFLSSDQLAPGSPTFHSLRLTEGASPQWRKARRCRTAHLMLTDNALFYTACGLATAELSEWRPPLPWHGARCPHCAARGARMAAEQPAGPRPKQEHVQAIDLAAEIAGEVSKAIAAAAKPVGEATWHGGAYLTVETPVGTFELRVKRLRRSS